jgi:hypothetical protein
MTEQETPVEALPGEGAQPLSFEAWADLSARLMSLDPDARLDILDEHDLDEQDWMRWDEHHCLALGRDVAQGRMDRAEGYARKCAAEMERRRTQAEAPAPNVEAVPQALSEPAEPAPVGAPLAALPPDTPSFLQAHHQAPAPLPARTPNPLALTADAFQVPTALRSAALPFNPSASPSPAAGPTVSAEPRAPSAGSGTMPLGATLPIGDALPFDKGGAEPTHVAAFPRLTLDAYASLYAELAVFPDKVAEVFGKYKVRNGGAKAALDQDWQTRFDAHPETRAQFQTLYASYVERLQRQPRT